MENLRSSTITTSRNITNFKTKKSNFKTPKIYINKKNLTNNKNKIKKYNFCNHRRLVEQPPNTKL